jgi:YegS/Rv2252/BmrU family lipid kinase
MKIVVICNPKSRAGEPDNLELILRQKLAGEELEFKTTAYPGQATAIARRAVQGQADVIVVVGGDGTIHEVLNGVVGARVSLAVIPAGTANDLARYYHLPRHVDKAADMIRERLTCRADVIQVNNRYYLTAGGVGFPSLVASIADSIKNRTGLGRFLGRLLSSKLYIVAALRAVFSRSKEKNIVRVGSNGKARTEDIFSLTINNQPFLGKNFLVAPGAVNDDGQMDVCLIQNSKNALDRLMIVLKVLAGRHANSPSVRLWRTDHLRLEAEKPLPFLGDGEIIPGFAKFDIRVVPGAVDLIVPAHAGDTGLS